MIFKKQKDRTFTITDKEGNFKSCFLLNDVVAWGKIEESPGVFILRIYFKTVGMTVNIDNNDIEQVHQKLKAAINE